MDKKFTPLPIGAEKCDDCGKAFKPKEKRFSFTASSTNVDRHWGPFCKKCRNQFVKRMAVQPPTKTVRRKRIS